ncbi:hypothetical protein B0T18DRAFT_133047 [Schizothecium vesticola]|uniref:Uncharacterized protein n=1 Tax=Schizothecium vesticola TaxID=314040 RepID=A0AA40K4F1_9PEZI|nr:hypothetical protein B0T18DRAFT_133047 [Schizothecium vesticola]
MPLTSHHQVSPGAMTTHATCRPVTVNGAAKIQSTITDPGTERAAPGSKQRCNNPEPHDGSTTTNPPRATSCRRRFNDDGCLVRIKPHAGRG